MKPVSLVLFALAVQALARPSVNHDEDGDSTLEHTEHHWDTPPTIFPNLMASRKPSNTPNPPPMGPKDQGGDKEPRVPLSRRQAATTTKTTTTTRSSTTTTRSSTTTSTTRSSTSTSTTRTTSTTARGASTVDAAVNSGSTTRSSTTTTRSSTTSSRSSTTTTKPTTTTTTTKTTTKSTTTTTKAAATRTIDVTGMTYVNAMLAAHNAHRANHSIPDLVWNQDLANTAQKIANSCSYGHNVDEDGGGYGQNIGAGAPGNAAAGLVTNLMYNGEINYYPQPYGNDNPSFDNFHIWGHYSQLVWTDTTDVGCVTKYCPNGLANTGPGVAPYFTVCNYSPPGNYIGEFSEVATPGGGATLIIVGS